MSDVRVKNIVCRRHGDFYMEHDGLVGSLEYWPAVCQSESHVVRVYKRSEFDGDIYPLPIYVMSFGDYAKAEDRLLELLENASWTLLKYG